MLRAITTATLLACHLLVFGAGAVSAGDQGGGDKLPEPAHQFAKEAGLRVTEMERDWVKLTERLARGQADFAVSARAHTDGSLRDTAGRLLASAKRLLADHKQMGTDLERFKDALIKAASSYREVAALYKAHAAEARAEEVRQDYLQLAEVYERKASAAAERARKVAMPAGARAKAEIIEEGNLFLERLVEALALGPVADGDRGLFTARLQKHGERCKALAEELSRGAEKVLEGSDAPEVRQKAGGVSRAPGTAPGPPEACGAKGGPRSLVGAAWSSPVTVSGVPCVQVLRLGPGGTCSQSVYLAGPKGKGAFVAAGRATFHVDAAGILSFYRTGVLVERGQVSFVGDDRWSYEILENTAAPGLAGTRLTFTRDR